jgi:hypothetical protein
MEFIPSTSSITTGADSWLARSSLALILTQLGGGENDRDTGQGSEHPTHPGFLLFQTLIADGQQATSRTPLSHRRMHLPPAATCLVTPPRTKEGCCAQSLHRPCVKPMMSLPPRSVEMPCGGCGALANLATAGIDSGPIP